MSVPSTFSQLTVQRFFDRPPDRAVKPAQVKGTDTQYPSGRVNMTCKMVLLGNSGVGKTQVLQGAISSRADNPLRSYKEVLALTTTIGVDFRCLYGVVNGMDVVKTILWDTAGQEKYFTLMPQYVRGADAVLLVYDVTDPMSFEAIEQRWLRMIDDERQTDPHMVVVLIANKCDEGAGDRLVTRQAGEECARKNAFDAYFETTILDRRTIFAVIDGTTGLVYAVRKHRERLGEPVTVSLGPRLPAHRAACCSK